MSDALNRYHALFTDVPLFGGQEWKSVGIDGLVTVHTNAIDAIIELSQAEKKSAIEIYGKRNKLVRWLLKVRGWQAPYVPTEQEVAELMIARLRNLADWMDGKRNSRFFQNSDMSDYIVKPRAVANELECLFIRKE